MLRSEMIRHLEDWLEPEKLQDYCPNGLQVEGRSQVTRLVTGVTASEALIDRAIEAGADAILVHHGYFWKGEPAALTGAKGRRIRKLMQQDINLIAYHLPLDVHPELGNNARLAKVLGLKVTGQHRISGVDGLLWQGELARPMEAEALAAYLSDSLGREPLLLGAEAGKVYQSIAWCTGGAQGYLPQAAALGVDIYLSGECSEQTYHAAIEEKTLYVSAGHHATERYGVQALGEKLAAEFGIEHLYVELDNPV